MRLALISESKPTPPPPPSIVVICCHISATKIDEENFKVPNVKKFFIASLIFKRLLRVVFLP